MEVNLWYDRIGEPHGGFCMCSEFCVYLRGEVFSTKNELTNLMFSKTIL